jgi:hypothetical protein
LLLSESIESKETSTLENKVLLKLDKNNFENEVKALLSDEYQRSICIAIGKNYKSHIDKSELIKCLDNENNYEFNLSLATVLIDTMVYYFEEFRKSIIDNKIYTQMKNEYYKLVANNRQFGNFWKIYQKKISGFFEDLLLIYKAVEHSSIELSKIFEHVFKIIEIEKKVKQIT